MGRRATPRHDLVEVHIDQLCKFQPAVTAIWLAHLTPIDLDVVAITCLERVEYDRKQRLRYDDREWFVKWANWWFRFLIANPATQQFKYFYRAARSEDGGRRMTHHWMTLWAESYVCDVEAFKKRRPYYHVLDR